MKLTVLHHTRVCTTIHTSFSNQTLGPSFSWGLCHKVISGHVRLSRFFFAQMTIQAPMEDQIANARSEVMVEGVVGA